MIRTAASTGHTRSNLTFRPQERFSAAVPPLPRAELVVSSFCLSSVRSAPHAPRPRDMPFRSPDVMQEILVLEAFTPSAQGQIEGNVHGRATAPGSLYAPRGHILSGDVAGPRLVRQRF